MSFTYSTLVQRIKDYTENDSTEFANAIDTIIDHTELRIYREADLDRFRKHATSTLTVGNRFLSKPSDFVLDYGMKLIDSDSNYNVLIAKDESFVQEYWPVITTTSIPKYYADWDHDTFVLAPTPDVGYTVEMAYKYRPPSLSATNTTSWIGTNAPNVLLYGCLIEAYAFMQAWDEPDIQGWDKQYKEALAALKFEEERMQRREEYRAGEQRGR